MRRPGFAILLYHAETRSVELILKTAVHNKSGISAKKPHGQVLCEISAVFGKLLYTAPNALVIREKAFSKFAQETQTLNKVTGITDMMLWSAFQQTFIELTPTQIKKHTTGDARADKTHVAASLSAYVGEHDYDCDDESDAVAVAVAYLIMEGYMDFIEPEEVDEYASVGKIVAGVDE